MSARENLTLGRPDATEADSPQAVEVAQAQFVYDLPWGLDTRIGEQGMSLSGGQRQRLALARAVLAKPGDPGARRHPVGAGHPHRGVGRGGAAAGAGWVTGIVVAHRASTVMLADRVAMLYDGTITHVGTHAELLATVPEYRELLSADDECDDAERSCAWEEDEHRNRLLQDREEQDALNRSRVPFDRDGRRYVTTGPKADDRHRRHCIDVPEDPDRQPTERWRGRFDEQGDDLPIDESLSRRREARALLGRLLRPYRLTVALLAIVVVVENAARLSIPSSCSAVSTSASRRSWTAARRRRCW